MVTVDDVLASDRSSSAAPSVSAPSVSHQQNRLLELACYTVSLLSQRIRDLALANTEASVEDAFKATGDKFSLLGFIRWSLDHQGTTLPPTSFTYPEVIRRYAESRDELERTLFRNLEQVMSDSSSPWDRWSWHSPVRDICEDLNHPEDQRTIYMAKDLWSQAISAGTAAEELEDLFERVWRDTGYISDT